jgi:two-component system CheB/CheR fusion protein
MAKKTSGIKGARSAAGPASRRPSTCPIVGMGASAGGVQALQSFVSTLQPGSGLAFVVVLHLDPDHKSLMPDLMSHWGRLPVASIEDDMPAEPDHVYVIPANTTLTIAAGRLHLSKPDEPRGHRNPVDTFFASLARDQAENAAGVILSGTGSDGTLGLRAIKEHGGVTLAQADAEHDGMVRSAVASGAVDFVLPAEEISAKLVEYFGHLANVAGRTRPERGKRKAADYFGQICALMHARTGNDFSAYKDKTVNRRIERRMQVLQIGDMQQYLERLRKDAREIDLLFQDMLIGVTDFFRDPPAFEALVHQVIPELFKGKGPDDTIRVWVPGCATGEEAYSIAILLRERMPRASGPKLQIFATDIDESALAVARSGRYPASIAKNVSPVRLERFFVREDGSYRVTAELREICLFSVHNLLQQPPFSRLDLISCRNLLIYLGPELQNRVIPLFHYALRNSGYLFLGTSENVTQHARLFATIDRANRVFQRRPQAGRVLPEIPLMSPYALRRPTADQGGPAPAEGGPGAWAGRQVLERYAPAYVVINAEGDVLFASRRTGKYLELPAGSPRNNIFDMARPGLRIDLRAAVHKVAGGKHVVVHSHVTVGTNGGRQTIDLIVHPQRRDGAQEAIFLVVFQDIGGIEPVPNAGPAGTPEEIESANLRQLEAELQETRQRLQSNAEDLESSNEELKSGNEELSSMNEELQSANEELGTSKEELQSTNEELHTVNAELKMRVDELSRANSDLSNLMASTQIATVFLDRDLAVMSFTPAAKDVFHLIESDVGRPIAHVRPRFGLDTLEEDAERVLRTLSEIERPVSSNDGKARYIMRILPYLFANNVIGGVVITFVDITRITAAEARVGLLIQDLRNRTENLTAVLDLIPVGILAVETGDREHVLVNRYVMGLLGERDEQKGLRLAAASIRLLQGDRELLRAEQPQQRAARTGEAIASFEARLLRADGKAVDVLLSATPLFDEEHKPRGAIAAIVDISGRKRAEVAQDALLHELQHRVKNILATVIALAKLLFKRSSSLEGFYQPFMGRMTAMSSMHALLSQRNWLGADLRDLIGTILAPYVGAGMSNIVIKGPEMLLRPRAVSPLGMVVHELATNAAKYGALSSDAGVVEVSWRVTSTSADERVSLAWVERNGPRVEPPQTDGFGTNLIKRSVEYELEGTATLKFEPEGLRCDIDFPVPERGEAEIGIEPLGRPG